jgi:hypothetical protein
MASTTLKYQRPSRGSRALVIVLAIFVALLALWIVITNVIFNYAVSRPAVVQGQSPPQVQSPAVEPELAQMEPPARPSLAAATAIDSPIPPRTEAPVTPPTEPPVAAEIEPAPPLPEPIVIAAAQPSTPAPSEAIRLAAPIAPEPSTGVVESTIERNEAVPLPPIRPKVATMVPLPRPRPVSEDSAEQMASMQTISEAEIERLQPR